MTENAARTITRIPTVAPILTGHFREQAGYATWRPRGTADWLLIFTVDGSGRFGTPAGGEPLLTRPGDLMLLRPGTLHDYGTAPGAERWEILWTHFLPRPHWQDWLSAWPDRAGCPGMVHAALPGAERDAAEGALREMHGHARGGSARRDAFALNSLETALLWCDHALIPFGGGRMDERIRRARAHLLGHLSESVSITALAGQVGLSVSRLAHLFRDQTGQTPQQFVETERMTRAQQLLERTGRTVGAIAEEVGFENPFYFSLRFKKHTGLSPRDWRRERQQEEAEPGRSEGAHSGNGTRLY